MTPSIHPHCRTQRIGNAGRITRGITILTAATLVLSACGTDDGASVRDLGSADDTGSSSGSASRTASGSASVTASGSASGSASSSASGSASAPADEPAACSPVNEQLAADATATVDIVLTDFAFDQDRYEVEAGTITFAVTNNGSVNHEVAFLPGGGDVPYTDGVPDEEALEAAGAFELEAFGSGQTCTATYELEPGTYTLFCIVPIDDEHNHYDAGMRATLVVT